MRLAAILVLLGVPWACAAKRPPVANELRLVGGRLACITDTPPAGSGYEPCLHIGKARVGGKYAEIVETFGKADMEKVVEDGHAHVYLIDEKTETYIVFTERKGEIVAVQLTGRAAEAGFAGVHLGDDTKQLVATLGPAAVIAHEGGYDLWSYRPLPVSIEIRDGRVYSIKVWKP